MSTTAGSRTAWLLTRLRIWDGERTLDADTVKIADGRIQQIGTAEDLARDTAKRIDCSGLWAMPGLIDAHVHLELDPERREPPARGEAPDRDRMIERAGRMLRAGITSARDLGGGSGAELWLRDAINRGEVSGPRLWCAGQPITTPGGHCHFWGGEAGSTAAALAVLERQIEKGSDLIKVMASGGVMTRNTKPADAQFEQDTLDAIVAAARAASLTVAAHCHSTLSIDRAARAGVRTIEHCSWVGPDGWGKGYDAKVVEHMLTNRIWVSPTINLGWQRHLTNSDSTRRDQLRAIFSDMRERGVPLIASTDAGIPGVHHQDLPKALPVMQQLTGLSTEATLRSATSEAARGIGFPAGGWLRVGEPADLLLVDGDPTADLSVLAQPVEVYKAGRAVLNAH
ncbi:MAG: amidohydrolase family protein [Pseudomonadota bacterium]